VDNGPLVLLTEQGKVGSVTVKGVSHTIWNSVASILANVNKCVPLSGANRNPQFLLLDFVNLGQGFAAADQLNGLATSNISTSAPPVNNGTTVGNVTSTKTSGAIKTMEFMTRKDIPMTLIFLSIMTGFMFLFAYIYD